MLKRLLGIKETDGKPDDLDLDWGDSILRERNKFLYEEYKRRHEEQEGHDWVEITTLASNEREWICWYCDASKTEPFEQAE